MSQKVKHQSFSAYSAATAVIQAAVFAIPFGASGFRNLIYIFPPLGESLELLIPLTLLLVGVASVLPWFVKTVTMTRRLAFLAAGTLVFAISSYASLASNSLLRVPVFAQNETFYFIKGNERTAKSKSDFGMNCERIAEIMGGLSSNCEVAMIQALGPTDESIEEIWTHSSIIHKQYEFLASYLGSLLSFNLFVGALAKNVQLRQ